MLSCLVSCERDLAAAVSSYGVLLAAWCPHCWRRRMTAWLILMGSCLGFFLTNWLASMCLVILAVEAEVVTLENELKAME